MSWLVLLVGAALADPVDNGIQARLFPKSIAAIEAFVEGQEFPIYQDEITGKVSCYERVGVRNFNLNVPVQNVTLVPRDHYVELTVDFGTITGTNMQLFGEDWPLFDDMCINAASTVNTATITNGRLVAKVGGVVQGGRLVFQEIGQSELTGDITVDTDLGILNEMLPFVQDIVMEKAGAAAMAEVLPMLTDYMADLVLHGNYGLYAMDLQLNYADLSPQRLAMTASGEVYWTGVSQCQLPVGSVGQMGRSPDINLDAHSDSSLAIGITERMLNRIVQTGYYNGWWCLNSDLVEGLLSSVQEQFDPVVGILDASAEALDPPMVVIEDSGTRFYFDGLRIWVGPEANPSDHVILATADMAGTVELSLNQDLTAFDLTIRDLELDIREFSVNHLTSEREGAEERLRHFFETWLVSWIETQVRDLTLFAGQYHAWDMVIRMDHFEREPGALKLWMSLYDLNDPAVDLIAPDTATTVAFDADAGGWVATWSGEDDRAGPLGYSWRIDGTGWKTWSTDTTHLFDKLDIGVHTFEVQARDSWLNVDSTPASFEFEITEEEVSTYNPVGCQCSGMSGRGGLGALSLALLIAARRRRR